MTLTFVRLAVLAGLYMGLGAGSCVTTDPSATADIDIGPLPPNLSAPCERPVRLPESVPRLPEKDSEHYWAIDRTNLAKCGNRNAALVSDRETLRKNLAGGTPMIDAQVPAAGGGLWVRIHVRFGPRLTEWMLAVIMLGWGAVVLQPGDLFAQPTYAGFRVLFGNEVLLGYVMLAIGFLRLGGLIVNGARKQVTPWIRVSSAGIGFLIWIGMAVAHSMAGILGVWAVFYPVFAAAEIINVIRAARDAGGSHGPA